MESTGGGLKLRADSMGVGHVGAVRCGVGDGGEPRGDDERGGASRERELGCRWTCLSLSPLKQFQEEVGNINGLEGDNEFSSGPIIFFCEDNNIRLDTSISKEEHISNGNKLGIIDRLVKTLRYGAGSGTAGSHVATMSVATRNTKTTH